MVSLICIMRIFLVLLNISTNVMSLQTIYQTINISMELFSCPNSHKIQQSEQKNQTETISISFMNVSLKYALFIKAT